MSKPVNCALALDPGTLKCGVAVVRMRADGNGFEIAHQSVISRNDVMTTLRDLGSRYSPDVILVGDGTMCDECRKLAEQLGVAPVHVVDEKFSTLLARRRYFESHPPRGLRRLIPISLQIPPQPYDDYVAVILAESFLSTTASA